MVNLSQQTINWLNFLWTSTHDVFYLYGYWVLTHLRLVKKHRSLEERVTDLEKNKTGVKPR